MRKAFISPAKYVQGEDELLNLGYFVSTFGKKALLIAHPDDISRVKEKLDQTAARFSISLIPSNFQGEVSGREVARLKKVVAENECDCVVGLGGGKAIDAAKCVAEGQRLIVVPTIVATDAPTSHCAVLYTEDGLFDRYVYFVQNPSVVLIDTVIIANAPTRFLVSGMGDALSTYFEARAVRNAYANVDAGLACGAQDGSCPPAKGTNAAFALASYCYETLLEDGVKAKEASDNNVVTPALENIIEANSLLSGLGFESGGLAAIHAIHDGLSILPSARSATHGEKVSFCTICQLVLENAPTEELREVLDFSLSVGLPVCLADIGIEEITEAELTAAATKACAKEEPIEAMPFPITIEQVKAAIVVADRLGAAHKASK
jgi:glycerol dehydrogenase